MTQLVISELGKKIISALLNLSWASLFLVFVLSDGFCAFTGIAWGAQPFASNTVFPRVSCIFPDSSVLILLFVLMVRNVFKH